MRNVPPGIQTISVVTGSTKSTRFSASRERVLSELVMASPRLDTDRHYGFRDNAARGEDVPLDFGATPSTNAIDCARDLTRAVRVTATRRCNCSFAEWR